ncbi:MAG: LysR family transcriptional regulator [Anaerolineaceae bacterium]|nr:LysR family transcriptional regulator [Anaerolineaceae bacterium]
MGRTPAQNMDFKELSYVIAIAQYQSITKAANSLYLTQPTLSKFLQQLESSLGQKLFDRIGRKMLLTQAGECYVKKAQEIIRLSNELHQEIAAISTNNSGILKIGVSSLRGSEIIMTAVPPFSKLYPNVQLKFFEIDSNSFEPLLLSGDLDLAFYNLPIQSPNINYTVLRHEEVILIASKDHSLNDVAVKKPECKYPWIDLRWAKNERFIMLSEELRMYSLVKSLLDELEITPNIWFYTRNVASACILASEGYALAFTGEQHIKYTKFEHVPSMFSIGSPNLQRSFVVATRKNRTLPEYAQELIKLVQNNPPLSG